MLVLQNGALRVDVLDPAADAARQGPRFCWGGYIWQVHDAVAGPLLSGPEWPKEKPTAFNGQGLPESFRHRTLEGKALTWHGDTGVALGAGEIYVESDGRTLTVATPCRWQVTRLANRLVFVTRQEAAGFAYELIRVLELNGRDLLSSTKLTNLGSARLQLEWFAHPFFPLPTDLVRAQFPVGAVLAENPGFTLQNGQLVQKRRFVRQDDGHMDRVQLPANEPLRATLPHPKVGEVVFETSFAPTPCVIWGNDRTFSIEPYLPLGLARNESREWNVRYRFGSSSGASSPGLRSRTPDAR